MELQTITLEDAASGATARITPGFGFNCYSFRAATDGGPVEMLWTAPDFLSGKSGASHSGIPILFPFAGRLRGMRLEYEGRVYPLEGNDGLGNAIHGFVLKRPWRLVEQGAQRAVGEFQASLDEPGLLDRWPGDFRLRVAYEVRGNRLESRVEVFNPGQVRLPFGLGVHCYFRLPLGEEGPADDCRVTVPVSEYWELVNMLPSGKRLPATGPRNLAQGLRFAEMHLDEVFTGILPPDGRARATIEDPCNGRTLEIGFDKSFHQCVVYNPPHRQAVCIEPYTAVPDAFSLAAGGCETGLRILGPGETFSAGFALTLR